MVLFSGRDDARGRSGGGELAELYEAEVQIRRFAETLTNGCGPGCGTDEATGGGCGSCSTGCAVAGTCQHPAGTRSEAQTYRLTGARPRETRS